jgi:hypothetical protein
LEGPGWIDPLPFPGYRLVPKIPSGISGWLSGAELLGQLSSVPALTAIKP